MWLWRRKLLAFENKSVQMYRFGSIGKITFKVSSILLPMPRHESSVDNDFDTIKVSLMTILMCSQNVHNNVRRRTSFRGEHVHHLYLLPWWHVSVYSMAELYEAELYDITYCTSSHPDVRDSRAVCTLLWENIHFSPTVCWIPVGVWPLELIRCRQIYKIFNPSCRCFQYHTVLLIGCLIC